MSDRKKAHDGKVRKFVAPVVEPVPVQAQRFLETWGLRTTGGTLKSVGPRRPSGQKSGIDEAAFIVAYVQSTEGFERAHPVLLHVYGEGLPLSKFFFRGPGEPLSHALARLGWFAWIGHREAEIPGLVVEEFRARLEERLRVEGFRLPDPHEVGEASEVEDALNAERPAVPQESLRVRYYGRPE